MKIHLEITTSVRIVAVEREADDDPETAIDHASYEFVNSLCSVDRPVSMHGNN